MSRHPWTYSCDFIREYATDGEEIHPGIHVSTVSRASAASIRNAIANIIGMDKEELAEKLSLAYMAKHEIKPQSE